MKDGSSPRVWGTLDWRRSRSVPARFIPTCVGNMDGAHKIQSRTAVHPHVCGEHFCYRRHAADNDGSSPRVWGTYGGLDGCFPGDRFIPTCVGNIKSTCCRIRQCAVHPHVCGEHNTAAVITMAMGGSSPRVWGTCLVWNVFFQNMRVIPTGVGNMTLGAGRTFAPAVHPHVCGEHGDEVIRDGGIGGSSPRVWGTCCGHKYLHHKSAGSSPRVWGTCLAFPSRERRPSVHPHVCGEHEVTAHHTSAATGSSPRVWGTCKRQRFILPRHRFIPTCVGNIR